MVLVVAIDGPAGAGKGTVARALAARFDAAYLDTGLLYRGLARAAALKGISLNDAAAIAALTPDLSDTPALRSAAVAEAASTIAVHEAVRAALLDFQRDFAKAPPGGKKVVVLDGRDIGTVVCPDAGLKIFLTASAEVRAQRRLDELRAAGDTTLRFTDVLKDVNARDARDASRTLAPLTPAADAVIVDTSTLSVANVTARCAALVEKLMN